MKAEHIRSIVYIYHQECLWKPLSFSEEISTAKTTPSLEDTIDVKNKGIWRITHIKCIV